MPVNLRKKATLSHLHGRIIESNVGRFCLFQYIGGGSFGAVYEAVRLTSDDNAQSSSTTPASSSHLYAVKCMRKACRGTNRYRRQQDELVYHQLLSEHQNVVSLHAVAEDSDHFYMIMDLCSSGDLQKRTISKQFTGKNRDARIKNVFGQILDAVEHCHDLGVYHRDLKTDNFLVRGGTGRYDDVQVLLTDFGLASRKESSRDFGCGTTNYMSPECVGELSRGEFYHRGNDVWALGVILIGMITLRLPWSAASPADMWFTEYLADPRSLSRGLNISYAATRLLRKIFCLDMFLRIDIPGIRAELENIDSFFADEVDDELVGGTGGVDLEMFKEKATPVEEVKERMAARIPMPTPVPEAVLKPEKYRGLWGTKSWRKCQTRMENFVPRMMRTRGVGIVR